MASKKKARKIKPASKLLKVKKAKATAANGKAPIPVQTRIKTKAKEQVTVAKAKGRPMLSWVGKRPLRAVTAFPAQHIESFAVPHTVKVPVADATIWKDWPKRYLRGGLLFHGDNKEVLAHLLANGFRGQVQLIYIDPPFDSGADYVRKVQLRGGKSSQKIDGETYALGEQIQYSDIWANDNYLQFIYERLILLRELLSNDGNFVLHCDWHRAHLLRCLMDEVFGADCFRNQIVWRYSKYQMRGMSRFVNNHDVLFWYSKSSQSTYNPITEKLDEPKLLKRKRWDKDLGRIVNIRDKEGQLVYDEYHESKVDDVWDLDIIGATSGERLDYATQKPEVLLDRVIASLSSRNDVILDCFIGSGTTAAVAQKLGRRWIGCDINKGAIQTTSKRLQAVITEQLASAQDAAQQMELITNDIPEIAPPAQLVFTTWRVNDYDLSVQHNEAVNLACEHIGVTRTLADAFFDGTLGTKLVKIIPFGHPLSPADLEDVKRELDARANESRDVVVVCLGKELSVDAWLAEWNRMRKQGDTPNKIEVIELRSDSKYGKFIAHKPAQARVEIRRVKDKEGDKLVVEVKDFISPAITERLQAQTDLLSPKISDWRAMVDSVMIDLAYDGKVFNIALADVPERKQDYVKGSYELPAPTAKTIVAVKVTDMLGEEVIVTATV